MLSNSAKFIVVQVTLQSWIIKKPKSLSVDQANQIENEHEGSSSSNNPIENELEGLPSSNNQSTSEGNIIF